MPRLLSSTNRFIRADAHGAPTHWGLGVSSICVDSVSVSWPGSTLKFTPFTPAALSPLRFPPQQPPVLDRFDSDPFWGVQDTVVRHPNISRETLLRLLAGRSKNRGVVYTEARNGLETDGVPFDHEGFAIRV